MADERYEVRVPDLRTTLGSGDHTVPDPATDFDPVEIRGEDLSATLLREDAHIVSNFTNRKCALKPTVIENVG